MTLEELAEMNTRATTHDLVVVDNKDGTFMVLKDRECGEKKYDLVGIINRLRMPGCPSGESVLWITKED